VLSFCAAEVGRLHRVEFVDGVENAAGGQRVGEAGRRRRGAGGGVDEQRVQSVVKRSPDHVQAL